MALNVNDVLSVGGGFAANGAYGADAVAEGLAGADGADGAAGLSTVLTIGPAIFTGTTTSDSIVITRAAQGQQGGNGGRGGAGGNPPLLSISNNATSTAEVKIFGDGGAGGAGGDGGSGGAATVGLDGINLRLAQAGAARDSAALTARAQGAAGGAGDYGGDGGSSGPLGQGYFVGFQQFFNLGVGFAASQSVTMGQGGDAGAPGAAGVGGNATAAITGTVLRAASADLSLLSEARAGNGNGSGYSGVNPPGLEALPGNGNPPGAGHDGGRGSDGGNAVARLEGTDARFTGFSTAALVVVADAGDGYAGAQGGWPVGGAPNPGAVIDRIVYQRLDASGQWVFAGEEGTTTLNAGPAGAGGDGGDGGDALARLAGNRLTFGAEADTTTMRVEATAGSGGAGGAGVQGRAPSTVQVFTGSEGQYVMTQTDTGYAASPDGARGANGTARIELINNRVDLGAGDDVLNLSLTITSGEGAYVPLSAATITASGNAFLGGDGADTLNLAGIGATNLTIDLALGRLKAGAVTLGTLSGFETIIGSAGADRFVDGAGNQTYRPSGPQNAISPGFGGPEPGDVRDTFVFGVGHGHDTILGFDATGPVYDRIDLRAFGTAMDTFREVRAAARDEPGLGCVIDTPDGGSITLLSVAKAELVGSMFLF